VHVPHFKMQGCQPWIKKEFIIFSFHFLAKLRIYCRLLPKRKEKKYSILILLWVYVYFAYSIWNFRAKVNILSHQTYRCTKSCSVGSMVSNISWYRCMILILKIINRLFFFWHSEFTSWLIFLCSLHIEHIWHISLCAHNFQVMIRW